MIRTPIRYQPAVLELLAELYSRTDPPGVLLEQDDNYPSDGEILGQLASIEVACARGAERRKGTYVA